MEVTALSKNIRMSPRKLRPMAHSIKKLGISEALTKLKFFGNSAGLELAKTLSSAVSNAKINAKLEEKNLKIKNIVIDEGFKMKRQDKSHGARFGSGVIQKRASHIKVILEG